MTRKKQVAEKPKTTLAELVSEAPYTEEWSADMEYFEKKGISPSQIPQFYNIIAAHVKTLEQTQNEIRSMYDAKNSQTKGWLMGFTDFIKGTSQKSYQPVTVDQVVQRQMGVLKGLDANIKRAVDYISKEAKHLEEYGAHSVEEFDKAKKQMYSTDTSYCKTETAIKELQEVLEKIPMSDSKYTPNKVLYDEAKRCLGKMNHRREVYAARVRFRLAESADLTAREESVRCVLYETQKMGDGLAMFLENAEQTANSTTVLETSYKIVEALRDSYNVLLDIKASRGIVEKGALEKFSAAAGEARYEFPTRVLENSITQAKGLRAGSSIFDEVNEMLTKSVIGGIEPKKSYVEDENIFGSEAA